MNQKILVIGGNGFIGRNVIMRAVSLGWDVTSVSLSGSGPKDASCIAADITDLSCLSAALSHLQFDYVVNCGGYVDHTLFRSGGRRIMETHFGGLLNLVEVLDRTQLKTFVNIGSSDEYGNNSSPQQEDSRESPITPYSMGKLASSHFLQMLHKTESFPAVTLRLFLAYGPGQNENRFLPQIINGCLQDKSFPTSFGEQIRDFCYIDDIVEAIFSTLHSNNARGEVINIASGHPISIYNIINTVKSLIGMGNPMFGEVEYRTGENMELYADISKSNSLLGWAPQVPFEQGLSKTIRWYSEKV